MKAIHHLFTLAVLLAVTTGVAAASSRPNLIWIMADDLAAGLYANLCLQGAVRLLPGFLGRA